MKAMGRWQQQQHQQQQQPTLIDKLCQGVSCVQWQRRKESPSHQQQQQMLIPPSPTRIPHRVLHTSFSHRALHKSNPYLILLTTTTHRESTTLHNHKESKLQHNRFTITIIIIILQQATECSFYPTLSIAHNLTYTRNMDNKKPSIFTASQLYKEHPFGICVRL